MIFKPHKLSYPQNIENISNVESETFFLFHENIRPCAAQWLALLTYSKV